MAPTLTQDAIESLDDEALVALAQTRGQRDDRPFRELVRRHKQTVWRVCYGFVHNAADADDLAQEVFLKAYRNLDRFEGRAAFKTWVYRIAINTSKNELRRRSRRPQSSELTFDDAAEFLPDRTSVADTIGRREMKRHLAAAFARLSETEAEAIQLRDLEGRPYAEIASLLDISLSAAKMRVRRARQALRAAYIIEAGQEYAG